tara:strand:+ start:7517 stop:7915 length:399 start_codon:yes stop_codon:yes gene_type:complete
MGHHRSARVADLIKKEVSEIIQHELKDPRIGFVTVTLVDVSIDLRHAQVYFSVLGTELDQEKSLKSLQKATGFIRTKLGPRIKLRHIPELLFRYDESFDYAQRISNVINSLEITDSENNEIESSFKRREQKG